MKKIITAIFISILLLTTAHAQSISKKEAHELLEKAYSYLKTSDTTSFINLWQEENTAASKQKITSEFNFLREFLDTALTRNLKIDNVEIEKYNLKNTDTKYWIKAWFKYDEHNYKGFGFYVAYKSKRWVVRNTLSTSMKRKD